MRWDIAAHAAAYYAPWAAGITAATLVIGARLGLLKRGDR